MLDTADISTAAHRRSSDGATAVQSRDRCPALARSLVSKAYCSEVVREMARCLRLIGEGRIPA